MLTESGEGEGGISHRLGLQNPSSVLKWTDMKGKMLHTRGTIKQTWRPLTNGELFVVSGVVLRERLCFPTLAPCRKATWGNRGNKSQPRVRSRFIPQGSLPEGSNSTSLSLSLSPHTQIHFSTTHHTMLSCQGGIPP